MIFNPCRLILLIFLFYGFSTASAQVSFTSSDKDLEHAFNWAKKTALNYKGADTDPVGPWYEAALPSRYAFCMRDAAHQSIGAEILGLSRENLNMFTLFAKNISASKNWCSYWEINKLGKPAPEDYRNDKEFWYNLPANFDVLFATWRLYNWTGNPYYINNPSFVYFQEKTIKEYIDTWVLSSDSLLKRPAHLHTPIPYNEKDYFHSCRGLPSYSEGIPNMRTGVDLVAALYRGLQTYSDILAAKGLPRQAKLYAQKAERYRERLEADWWNAEQGHYYLYYSSNGKFVKDEPIPYLLWFDALKDTTRVKPHLAQIVSTKSNVETTSYFPYLFYKHGEWDQARKYILYLSNPATPRREYPEVSFGVIDGIVQGLMGIATDAQTTTISTLFRSNGKGSATVNNLPVLQTRIKLIHSSPYQSTVFNLGKRSFKWKAIFSGNYPRATVNGIPKATRKQASPQGKMTSWVELEVKPGMQIKVDVNPIFKR
jgi:hypothetical protein